MNPSARQAIAALETLYCPVNESINPEFYEIEKACTAWVDEFRLYWDEGQRARLLSTGAGEIYARALPFAPAEKVADVAKWLYWGFATDDMVYDAGPASIDSAAFLTVAAQLVRIIEEPRSRFAGEFAHTDALRDLTTAILRHATPQQRIDWVATARAWFFGMAWDSANAQRQTRPDLNDYLMMRMHTGGLASWLVTLGIAAGSQLSPDEAASPPLRAASEAWATMALLINDLMSFPKEVEQGQTSSNVVAVLMQAGHLEPGPAVHEAYVLVDTLSALLERLMSRLRKSASPEMNTYLDGMLHSWRGIIDWGFRCSRYVDVGEERRAITFPGYKASPSLAQSGPLPFPAISWWWEEADGPA